MKTVLQRNLYPIQLIGRKSLDLILIINLIKQPGSNTR